MTHSGCPITAVFLQLKKLGDGGVDLLLALLLRIANETDRLFYFVRQGSGELLVGLAGLVITFPLGPNQQGAELLGAGLTGVKGAPFVFAQFAATASIGRLVIVGLSGRPVVLQVKGLLLLA